MPDNSAQTAAQNSRQDAIRKKNAEWLEAKQALSIADHECDALALQQRDCKKKWGDAKVIFDVLDSELAQLVGEDLLGEDLLGEELMSKESGGVGSSSDVIVVDLAPKRRRSGSKKGYNSHQPTSHRRRARSKSGRCVIQ